jgi:hypothetical protein
VVTVGAGASVPNGDAVADDDRLRSDEDVFDQQSQHTQAIGNLGGVGGVVELSQEAVDVVGEFEVGIAVGRLRFEGVELECAFWPGWPAGRACESGARRW